MNKYKAIYAMVLLSTLLFSVSVWGGEEEVQSSVELQSVDPNEVASIVHGDANENIGGATRVGVSSSDSMVTASVEAAIDKAPELQAADVSIDTIEGVTTLTGTVDSTDLKQKIEQLVIAVVGVKNVNNELKIKSLK